MSFPALLDNADDRDSAAYESGPSGTGDGPLRSVFDGSFNGAARSEMYRAQVAPELFPHEKPMLIDNWPAEDREMYCGGEYTVGYAA